MKKLLLSMAVVAGTSLMASAADVVLSMNDAKSIQGTEVPEAGNTAAHTQPVTSLTVSGYTFTMSAPEDNTSSQMPAYYPKTTKDATLRLYKSNTLTIAAPAGASFKSVTITYSSLKGVDADNNVSPAVAIDTKAKTLTWSSETAVSTATFTLPSVKGADGNNPNLQLTTVTLSTEAGTVTPPTPPTPGDALWSALSENDTECNWTFNNVTIAEGVTSIWSWKGYSGKYYLNGSGYVNGAATVSEAYAISPALTITGGTKVELTFDHAAKFQTTLKELCGVAVREKGATTWTALTIPTWPEAGAWTFANCGNIDLSSYIGKTIEIAFKYASSEAGADTWEIRNLKLTGDATVTAEGGTVTPPNPPTPEVKTVKSVAEAKACDNNAKVNVEFPLTVAFVPKDAEGKNWKNVFCVDASGEAIQVYAANTYNDNDIIPAGWEATYTLHGGNTPELVPTATLPDAAGQGSYTPATVADGNVTVADVNRVLLFKDVTFAVATPSTKDNFEGTAAGKTLSFRNNYTIEGVEAGTYDVKVVVTIFNNEPSLYVISYSKGSTGVEEIEAANGEAVYYDLNGRQVKGQLEKGLYIRVQNGKATKTIVK